jgi:predicted dehydrogenase
MRLGLLSTARINDEILVGASESNRVEVVAVASRSAKRAQAYAAEHAIPRVHGSYEALLEDSHVAYRLELTNMADAVAGDAPALLGRDDVLGQARTIEALYRSAASGAAVSLS